MNPFLVEERTHLAISGGRTSGYMLRKVLDAFDGKLPEGVVPIFCNTGKEAPGTLDFVERMSLEWDVPIVWLEFTSKAKLGFKEVNYATASRKGEPFEALIHTKQRLPNIVSRFCTQWLKILTAHRYCVHTLGWQDGFQTALGLRADEPARVAKLAPNEMTPGEESFAPLAKAGITKSDVLAFWKTSSFDLSIDEDAGNCDLCFLKGLGQKSRLIQRQPGVGDWWREQEAWVAAKTGKGGAAFSKEISMADLIRRASEPDCQLTLFDDPGFQECRCTD